MFFFKLKQIFEFIKLPHWYTGPMWTLKKKNEMIEFGEFSLA